MHVTSISTLLCCICQKHQKLSLAFILVYHFFDKIYITVVSAYENVNMCSNNLKLFRKSINEEFQTKYQQPERMVDKLDAVLAIPRTAARQIYRTNVPVTTPKNYY